MYLRRLNIVLFFFAGILMLSHYAHAVDLDGASHLKVVAEEINPEPVEPGQDLTVKIRVTNEGSRAAANVRINLKMDHPFNLKTDSRSFDEPQNICSGCSTDNTYYFTVDYGAVSGIYPITVEITGEEVTYKEKINVQIRGVPDILFSAEEVGEKIRPESGFAAELEFRNVGSGIANKIKVSPLSDDFIKLGGSLELIESLRPGESEVTNFTFTVSEDVRPDSYKIPIRIEYMDEAGKSFETVQDFGVQVANAAELSLQNIKASAAAGSGAGETLELQLRVENIGKGVAKNVVISLDGDFEGDRNSYLGKLDEGDERPAIFSIRPKKSGSLNIMVTASYEDDFGDQELAEEVEIYVNDGGIFSSLPVILAFAAALAAISFLVYRHHKQG